MNKNREILKCFSFCTILVVLSGSMVSARTFIEIIDTPDTIEQDVMDTFLGNWHGKDGSELISVVSVNDKGIANTVVLNPEPLSVKKALVEEIAGVIPALMIDIEEQGKVVGQYSLILENGTLVGTFDDFKTGSSLDVTFKPESKKGLNS